MTPVAIADPGPMATVAAPLDAPRVPLSWSLIGLCAGLVWSLGLITLRWADESDAFQYLIWRSLAIVIVLESIAFLRRQRAMVPQAFGSGRLMLLTCACLLLASIAFVYALKTTTPANAAFLASLAPLLAVVLAKFTLREPLTRVTIVAVGVAFIGLLITLGADLDSGSMAGNLAALASAFGLAGYAVCVRAGSRRDWSPVMVGYALVLIVICLVVVTVSGEGALVPATDIALAMFHGGVFIVVGTTLFNLASRRIGAVPLAVFAQTEMVFVPLWGFLVLHERPSATSLLGGAVIFVAVFGKALIDARSR